MKRPPSRFSRSRQLPTEYARKVLLNLKPKALCSDLGEAQKHLVVEDRTVVLENLANAMSLRRRREGVDTDWTEATPPGIDTKWRLLDWSQRCA